MPKMKTHSGAAKRFKRTASGKLRFRRSNRAHILTKKTNKRKRQLRANALVHESDQRMVDRMLGDR